MSFILFCCFLVHWWIIYQVSYSLFFIKKIIPLPLFFWFKFIWSSSTKFIDSLFLSLGNVSTKPPLENALPIWRWRSKCFRERFWRQILVGLLLLAGHTYDTHEMLLMDPGPPVSWDALSQEQHRRAFFLLSTTRQNEDHYTL